MKTSEWRLDRRIATIMMLCAALMAVAPDDAWAEWQPSKPIDMVIMAGKGGGADKMARLLQKIVGENQWSPEPLIPINRPGGSGAEALTYVSETEDPDHTIMVTLNSFYTTPIRQPKLGIDIETFAPIARLAEDTFVLWVSEESGIRTLDEFIAKARENGSEWVMAGTGLHAEDHLLTELLNSTFRLNMTYVPYKGGGTVAKHLVAGHAHSTVNNPSEQLDYHEQGKSVPLAVFSSERLAMFPDTPTFRERGEGLEYFMQRSIVGAPGMQEEAVKFYQDLFAKVFHSPEWMAYRKDKSLQGELIQGDALMAYWLKERSAHTAMLKALGIIGFDE